MDALVAAAENLQMDGAFVTKGGRGTGGEVVDMTCGELLVLGRPTIATTIGKLSWFETIVDHFMYFSVILSNLSTVPYCFPNSYPPPSL